MQHVRRIVQKVNPQTNQCGNQRRKAREQQCSKIQKGNKTANQSTDREPYTEKELPERIITGQSATKIRITAGLPMYQEVPHQQLQLLQTPGTAAASTGRDNVLLLR